MWEETLPTFRAVRGWDVVYKGLKLWEERAGRLHPIFQL